MLKFRCCLISLLLTGVLLATSCAFTQDNAHSAPRDLRDCGERITNFHSDITVNADASMLVRETIAVIANGDQIKHGIYRDFPTAYRGKSGKLYRVGFTMLGAQRDGQLEPFHMTKQANGVRIYLGDPNFLLPSGEYTYTLTYQTTRQLGFFTDHDELYWNVTGNGWIFPIDKASATVILPGNIPGDKISVSGFTGAQGSTARELTASVDADGHAQFVTTQPLNANEGLTIVTTFPKGCILPPTSGQQTAAWFATNMTWLIALLCVLALTAYYLIAWNSVGRDPQPGVIIPLFAPPQHLSPAAVRFLREMKSDDKTFTAALINLAVKGYVTIEEQAGAYTVSRVATPAGATQTKAANPPSAEEQALLDTLLRGESITLGNLNYQTFQSAQAQVKQQLTAALGTGEYFATNVIYNWIGLALSLGLAAIVIAVTMSPDACEPFVLQGTTSGDIITFYIFGTVSALVGGGLLFGIAIPTLHAAMTGKSGKSFSGCAQVFVAIFILFFSLPFFFGGLFFTLVASATYSLFLLAIVLLHSIFLTLMKAYTFRGRKLMDAIEGFRLYLSVAEVDRLQSLAPPEKTPQLFEAFLPYALALDVEQQWSQQFASVLAQASVGGQPYHPAWYSGSSYATLGTSGFASALGSSFNNAISSSSTAPGSSSGSGGGGSSGGGGGGGGGGGW